MCIDSLDMAQLVVDVGSCCEVRKMGDSNRICGACGGNGYFIGRETPTSEPEKLPCEICAGDGRIESEE